MGLEIDSSAGGEEQTQTSTPTIHILDSENKIELPDDVEWWWFHAIKDRSFEHTCEYDADHLARIGMNDEFSHIF